ncbi:Uncharacterised protein [Mycobacteroides abscessus subsp. abscessus]|nr:Uncharacterised protein [Mycobacteroides abscessus subsp. abscessus]
MAIQAARRRCRTPNTSWRRSLRIAPVRMLRARAVSPLCSMVNAASATVLSGVKEEVDGC